MGDVATALGLASVSPLGVGYQNYLNRKAAYRSNKFNAKESALNRDFQERMSSTAYSRSHDDLISAGFNPLLALTSGSSTPSGAQATGGYATAENPFNAFSESVNSALSLKHVQAEIARIKQETNTSKANEEFLDHQIDSVDQNTAYKVAETQKIKDENERTRVQTTPYRYLNSVIKYFENDPTQLWQIFKRKWNNFQAERKARPKAAIRPPMRRINKPR